MRILFTPEGWADYRSWTETDVSMLRRVNELIEAVRRMPFAGIGKPEPLRGELSGWRSRRIKRDDRLVYKVEGTGPAQTLVGAACRFHHGR